MFCWAGVLLGMKCSSVIGCFVRCFVRPRVADPDLYGVLFGVGALFGYSVLFGVLFVEKMFCSCSQVWAEQCSCSANVVRLQSCVMVHADDDIDVDVDVDVDVDILNNHFTK